MTELLAGVADKILELGGAYGPVVLAQQGIIVILWRKYTRLVEIRHKEAQEARQELLKLLGDLPAEMRQILEEYLRKTVSIYKLLMTKEKKNAP